MFDGCHVFECYGICWFSSEALQVHYDTLTPGHISVLHALKHNVL